MLGFTLALRANLLSMASATVEQAQWAVSAIVALLGKQSPPLALWKSHKSASSTRQRLPGEDAIGFALLGPPAQAARPVHDPDLGVAVDGAGAAKPEHLLPA